MGSDILSPLIDLVSKNQAIVEIGGGMELNSSLR